MPSLNAHIQNIESEDNEYQLTEIDFRTLSLQANQLIFSLILLGKIFFASEESYNLQV